MMGIGMPIIQPMMPFMGVSCLCYRTQTSGAAEGSVGQEDDYATNACV